MSIDGRRSRRPQITPQSSWPSMAASFSFLNTSPAMSSQDSPTASCTPLNSPETLPPPADAHPHCYCPSDPEQSDMDSENRNDELDERCESRSVRDNVEALSGDDNDQDQNPRKRKKYHRHTPQQIQELETLFKECPHPDEKQRQELSKKLSLDSRQVKFWFQNRRTQMKAQIDRHENSILRHENDKLRTQNMQIREAMRNPICNNCGGPAMLGDISLEEQHLRVENARLKEELTRLCSLASRFLGPSMSSMANPISPSLLLELGVGSNVDFAGLSSVWVAPNITAMPDLFSTMTNSLVSASERSMLLELAMAAVEELVGMAQMKEPLWIPMIDSTGETLNFEVYHQGFQRITGVPLMGYVPEVSRETRMVAMNSLALVDTLMNVNAWADMFHCIIAKSATMEIISSGTNGTKNGALQLMNAELRVLSPLVETRKVNFLRFCKEYTNGIWAIADVSVDHIISSTSSYSNCRLLPTGCVVQEMSNGYSKVTWIVHAEYVEAQVHQLLRSLLRSGLALGAGRWLATLQRTCESIAILMSPSISAHDESGAMTAIGQRSMMKLAQRMTNAFCAAVCTAPASPEWSRLESDGTAEDVRVLTRRSGINDPGEPAGIVLTAATTTWIAIPPERLLDFLRDDASRSKWDILSDGRPMVEMVHIAKGQDASNAVSLLRTTASDSEQTGMLILQETSIDASGAMLVYAPVDLAAMHLVMNGGEASYVGILPSGFAVLPDGGGTASLLTVGFQILVNGQTPENSVETANNLISGTIQKIKDGLQYDN
ncbi:homeobox-leucine zipper protein ROC5-like [Canna indica]|uniref:Homeobox-leucine zipper protein ROC5-like n=1 Tax=Canna indica TaxID=4628 RepID=A0AAQ3L4L9_9LILI|nr:homeobox-leucine zipper protein ROC5-like [Canna indica]